MQELFLTLLAFFCILSPLVFIHELGHYLVARAFGVHAESFSIGFGPKLIGWTDKSGTVWKISPFLMGGYVKFLGDVDVASTKSSKKVSEKELTRTLHGKAPWKRIVIALAGPFANYSFAIILLPILFMTAGNQDFLPIVGDLNSQSLASKHGIEKGDVILAVSLGRALGKTLVSKFEDFRKAIGNVPVMSSLVLFVKHGETEKKIVFENANTKESGVWLGKLGIPPDSSKKIFEKMSFEKAIKKTLEIINPFAVIKSFDVKQMGGPIAIAQQSKIAFDDHWTTVLYFMAMMSVMLGFFNLLPLPGLDGGMVLFSYIEMVIRRPIPAKIQQAISFISFVFLAGLFAWLFWSDILKIPVVYRMLASFGLI